MVVFFSSDAQEEQNYKARADWIAKMPIVKGQWGHSEDQEFDTLVHVNQKGGVDSYVLRSVLTKLVKTLYPDVCDTRGKIVCIKIDGGPGQMDVISLAELRSMGVYLFPGVQNTTQISQETDQNYGLFKSMTRLNTEIILFLLIAIHRKREEESKENKTFPAPTLNRSHYPVITNGQAAEPATIIDGKITKVVANALPSPYATAFTAAKNKEAWDFCSAVPLTRRLLQHFSVHHELPPD